MHAVFQKFKTLPRNTQLAILFSVAVILWMLTGIFSSGAKTPSQTEEEKRLKTVTVRAMQAQELHSHISLLGRTVADELVVLGAHVAGDVVATPAENGDRVKKGALLVQLDQSRRTEAVAAAKAQVAAAEILVKAARRLSSEGFRAATTLAQREAELANAKRLLADANYLLKHTQVVAPSDGIVEHIHVKKGGGVAVEDAVVTFLNTDRFIVEGYASQQNRDLVEVGQMAEAKLINGDTLSGTIRSVARNADENTRTYRVELLVDGAKYPDVATGMSAKLIVPTGTNMAYNVPHSALVLDDEGTVGVMLVDADHVAKFYPVTMHEDEPEGMWISGLPAQINLVVRGQASLIDGDEVKPNFMAKNAT